MPDVRGDRPGAAVDRTTAALLSLLAQGGYEPGDLMPPERTLAEQFGVSRSTLRESLKELESRSLVSRIQGSGTRVLAAPRDVDRIGAGLDNPMSIREATEVREAIEPRIAELAAERATADDLRVLRDLVTREDEPIDASLSLTLDIAFHLALARAARNPLLLEIDRIVTDRTQSVRRGSHTSEDGRRRSQAGHRHILDAIEASDRAAAAAAMSSHLDDVDVLMRDAADEDQQGRLDAQGTAPRPAMMSRRPA